MPDTTLEEAKRCPTCKDPGEEILVRKLEDGTAHVYKCVNTRCDREGDRWLVQVRTDGTIPNRTSDKGGRLKEFPAMSDDQLSMGQRLVEDAVQQDLRIQQEGNQR